MPALPSVPNVLRLDHYFRVSEDLAAKTRLFWKYLSGPPTAAELATMAAAVRVAFGADLASLMTGDNSLLKIIITDLTSPTAAVGTDSTAVVGTRGGSSVSANDCMLESRHVARRFRGGHSRVYWPFGAQSDLNDKQTWKASFATECQTGGSNYASAIAAAIGAWGTSDGPVSVSYYDGFTVHTGTTGRARNVSTVRATPVVDPVLGSTWQTGIANQRRRLLHLA